ncbi:diguanylate cyclase domain-containing protein [Mycetocola zhujimingii]|uniref:diguanylate cyclase domain-containing protein n=1 Tax=Mycetocola zhujimingii TaxID=2079792 RepID=UPI000D3A804B|nr:diguanylate cyclase [Mycetocola zhujimingii]AWB85627.1 hypothetical protein C3E77_02630 [Mycetocola zhujimingii]
MIRTFMGGPVSLDLPTLLLTGGLVVTLCGTIFVLSTVLQHNDVPSRLWSAAFILGITTMTSFAVWAVVPEATISVGIGNGALAMSMGFIWSGSRAFNGRNPMTVASIAGGVIIAVAAWVDVASGSWAGGLVFLLGVTIFALLAAVESFSGRMRRSLNARMLGVIMALVGGFFAARSVVFATAGPDSVAFRTYLDSDVTTFVTILFVITASTSMGALRTENTGQRAPRPLDTGERDEFVSPEKFARAADDRLERLERRGRSGESGVLVRVEIDNLSEMNTAFGHDFRDAAVRLVGSAVRGESPVSAVLGRTASSGFDALLFDGLDRALECAQRIRSSLVDTPIDASQGLRVSVTIALAVPEPGERFAELAQRVSRFIADGHATGGNVIVGHPEEFSRA